MAKTDKVIKYTIIPRNEEENYDKNFRLSLKEFAKALESKSLVAPLIIYNSELDIPMDMEEELEEYCIYSSEDNLLDTIRNQENTDVFRCLIIHGFDISLDEVRDVYCSISRKNEADICINVIQDSEIGENLTFYLRNDLDKYSDEEWQEDKKQIEDDMQEYIDEYLAYDELSEEDMMDLLPFLLSGDMDKFDELIKEKKEKEKVPEKKTETDDKIIHIPLPMNFNKDLEKLEEEEESTSNAITCSYEYDSLIAISKVDEDFYIIEDDDYEIALTLDQMMFLMESFNRIKDKPVKK
jgi:hypothetical protein